MAQIKNFGQFHKLNESSKKHNYMMLSRLQSDCEYFLNHGGGSVKSLY